ncbi:DUF4402 domain-containing protein [Bdellovibrio sp. HCB2-146]|uniref:DUF4402 domain-containing protein n=1 Tax=Bdellovibrio sp. HCB2-146 TaxID=3394362 RepID=UPI0039BC4E04
MLCLVFFCDFTYARSIKISRLSDLDFGSGGAGDPAKIVPSGTSENATNASFLVEGDNNRAYSISLPATATIRRGTVDSITLSSFTSYPNANGLLNNLGEQNLYIGATRAALRVNQTAGSYSGTFTITVVY